MMSSGEGNRRTEPAKVYPSPDQPDCWVVEAPGSVSAPERVRLFFGSAAQRQALQFAHEAFGAARLFVR